MCVSVSANYLTSSATRCQMKNFYPFLLMSHNNIRNPPNLCVVCYGRNIRSWLHQRSKKGYKKGIVKYKSLLLVVNKQDIHL